MYIIYIYIYICVYIAGEPTQLSSPGAKVSPRVCRSPRLTARINPNPGAIPDSLFIATPWIQ